MGYRKIIIDYVHEMLKLKGLKLKGLKMCELGNQLVYDKYKGFSVAKSYFESLGVKHISIDWNGKNGALPLDMNEPIDIGKFDVVTNMGVAEHYKNEKQSWENIDNMTKSGGLIINLAPKVGHYKKHKCYRWYEEDWFYDLAKEKNYDILDIGIMNPKGKVGFDAIKCTLQKNGDKKHE